MDYSISQLLQEERELSKTCGKCASKFLSPLPITNFYAMLQIKAKPTRQEFSIKPLISVFLQNLTCKAYPQLFIG